MNRLDRITAILIQLQTKSWVTASEIAERYEVSLRTIYRDIRSLEEAGVPIGAEAGKGYFIVDGYHLPPVMFSREEAGAMIIAGKLLDKLTDKSLKSAYASAIDKIKSVLPTSEKDTLHELNNQVQVFYSHQSSDDDYPNDFLVTIQKALLDSKCIKMDYHAGYNRIKTKDRVIDPVGLVFYGNAWHLIAYCKLRESMRDFRLDRAQKMQVLTDCSSPKHQTKLKKYLEELWKAKDLLEVKVWFHEDLRSALNPSKYYFGYINEEKQTDGIIAHFAVNDLRYIGSWLLSFGSSCRVISPKELSVEMIKHVRELASVYLPSN